MSTISLVLWIMTYAHRTRVPFPNTAKSLFNGYVENLENPGKCT